MAGIENILSMIASQQHQSEASIISAAEHRAFDIEQEGLEKAEKAYDDYMKKAEHQLMQDHANAKASVDADMKRRILACKVECIDNVVEKTLEKLDKLPDAEYFKIIEKLLASKVRSGDGVLSMSKKDLARLPSGFADKASEIAKKAGGKLTLSDKAAEISNGFILEYGLIAENCSFRDIIEAEREGVRDTAARALFG